MKTEKNFKVYSFEQAKETGKVKADVRPHTDIVMLSGDGIFPSGSKCEHGNYIPATAVSPDHAPFCSLCYPYTLEVK
jgi:hypothetical protein